jgi:hypothetical protein
MTQFSPDNGKPPVRFSPGAGQTGAQAAMQGMKGGGKGTPSPSPSRGRRTDLPSGQGKGGGAKSPAPTPETSDYRHLILAAQYENIRRLGREIPFGNWLILNGHYRDVMGNDGHPMDWFRDL